jgi:hypothetical protein
MAVFAMVRAIWFCKKPFGAEEQTDVQRAWLRRMLQREGVVMPSEQEIWEEALIKADVWKPERCHSWVNCINARRYTKANVGHESHDIPAPAIGDPAATMRMLEWLLPHYAGRVVAWTGLHIQMVARGVPLAIAAAVCAVKGE